MRQTDLSTVSRAPGYDGIAVSAKDVTILPVQCHRSDGYAVHADAVRAEDVTIIPVQCNDVTAMLST
jgi:hypothetical protein